MLFLEWVTMTQGVFRFSKAESKVGVGDVMGLWASECWVASVTSLTMIEGEGDGLVVIAAIGVGVIGRKDIDGHQ